MDLNAAVRLGRRLAEATFVDTVTVEQHAGATTDDLGTRTDLWVPVYGGGGGAPGLVQADARQPQVADSAGRPVTVLRYIGKVPVEVALRPGIRYRVRVLTSPDPGNTGIFEGGLAESGESNGLAICRRLHLTRG
nr:MAG TPA: hypothetical protein [Caudoviricetes sp.]